MTMTRAHEPAYIGMGRQDRADPGSARRAFADAGLRRGNLMRTALLSLMVMVALMSAACTDDFGLEPDLGDVRPSPLLVPNSGYTQVTAGNHVCGLFADGTILCWGGNTHGQTDVPPLTDVIQVSAGNHHTCVLRTGGSVDCWGNTIARNVPGGLTDAAQVSAGGSHTCAVRADATVVCWGAGGDGQTSVPPGLSNVTQVDPGWEHTCALRIDATVVCWGADFIGQSSPPGLSAVTQVSAGAAHSCAVQTDGTVVCWGSNLFGQSAVPAGLADVTQVSAGWLHTCALRSDGTVTCWGQAPSLPAGISSVIEIVADNGLCVLRSDGSIECWGAANPRTHIDPTATFHVSASSVIPGEPFTLGLQNPRVHGYSGPVTFRYAFDCGAGYGAFSSSNTATCSITTAGNHDVRGTVMDDDGDTSEYSTTIAVTDETQPTITITTPADGAVYRLNQTVLADYVCDDVDSGIASCDGTLPTAMPIATTAAGAQSFTVDAVDAAGNTATLTHTYHVTYDFSGFASPVNNDGVNVVKAGRTIPLVWRIEDANGEPITNLTNIAISVADLQCVLDGSVAPLPEENTAGASGLQNLGAGEYQFNWKTPKSYAGSCMTLHLDLGEGITRTASFQFTK